MARDGEDVGNRCNLFQRAGLDTRAIKIIEEHRRFKTGSDVEELSEPLLEYGYTEKVLEYLLRAREGDVELLQLDVLTVIASDYAVCGRLLESEDPSLSIQSYEEAVKTFRLMHELNETAYAGPQQRAASGILFCESALAVLRT